MLLLDEPFASLDLPGQAKLAQDIAAAPQQILVSTHVLDHVRGFERVLWLEQGRIRGDGPGSHVCRAYEADVAARLAASAHSRAQGGPFMGSLYSEFPTWLHGWRAGLKLLLLAIGGTLLF